MKEQYVGDISDYRKYALLRALAGPGGLKPRVCWMLTPPDQRADGNKVGYHDEVTRTQIKQKPRPSCWKSPKR